MTHSPRSTRWPALPAILFAAPAVAAALLLTA